MNITPVTLTNPSYINNRRTAFSGSIGSNKYLENCIQQTLKSNNDTRIQNLTDLLKAILNDGTERVFEFDAELKNSAKGLKYAPTVKIDTIKQPLRLQAMFSLSELNKETMAQECLHSIEAIIKKCNIPIRKGNTIISPNLQEPIEIKPVTKQGKDLNKTEAKSIKGELELIYKEIFTKKQEKPQLVIDGN